MQKYLFESIHLNPKANNNKKIIFYGAGLNGRAAINKSIIYGIKPDYICDSDHSKAGSTISGIDVISPDILAEFDKDSPIVITSMYTEEIEDLLNGMGFKNIFINGIADIWEQKFYKNVCEEHRCFVKSNKHKIEQVKNILHDKRSLEIFESVLKARDTQDFGIFAKIFSDDQYFPKDIIKLGNDEIFVDAGASWGDTAIQFAKKTGYQYKKIYSFEPSVENIKSFTANIKNFKNIELFPYGLYDKNGIHMLMTKGVRSDSCNINDSKGNLEIETRRLDDILFSSERITYIKMDIEGSELEALEGAKNIIQRDVPKLAISAYHKTQDVWEIPIKIHKINPRYKIHLRHHGNFHYGETLCYAVL